KDLLSTHMSDGLACQQCRYSGTISIEGFRVPFWVLLASKKLKKRSKGLQTHAVRRHRFCLRIQKGVNSFEADRKNRVAVLSLLRMPISPLRRRLTSTVYQTSAETQWSLDHSSRKICVHREYGEQNNQPCCWYREQHLHDNAGAATIV